MLKKKISIGVIEQGADYIFQKRKEDIRLGAAGLIGCFGGGIEKKETAIEAVAREFAEETNLVTQASDWEYKDTVMAVSDRDMRSTQITAEVFHYILDEDYAFEAYDGKAIFIPKNIVRNDLNIFTPATRAIFEKE